MSGPGIGGRVANGRDSALVELRAGTLLYLYFLAHAAFLGSVLYIAGRRDLAFAISILVMLVSGIKEGWNDLQALVA